jgi:hypothetical protein
VFVPLPIRGTGFAPNVDIQFRIDHLERNVSFTFNAPGQPRNEGFRTSADGSFATNFRPDMNDRGRERWTASDGERGVSVDVVIAAP